VEQDPVVFFIRLLVCLLCGWGGYALAKRKNRSAVAWFFVCFFLVGIGLLVLACLSKRRIRVTLTPDYDHKKWHALVASDPAIAVAAEQLKPFGERYVAELASLLLGNDTGQPPGPIVESIIAKAKAYLEIAADPARLDTVGRNVHCVCRTVHDLVAVMSDGTVLAQRGDEFSLFLSVRDYRSFYADRQPWQEITNLDEKRRFFASAYPFLERVNASLGPRKREITVGMVYDKPPTSTPIGAV
jgi:hypothetical protein